AVLEFGYDWRLPVLDNARLLARAAHAHLTAWRAHPAHDHARRVHPDERPAQLVLVAHSMGGLLARALPLVEGTDDSDGDVPALTPDIRATITLGTPFEGAAKVAVILGTGRGVPLPTRRLTRLARTLPGMYDLLPRYRCVDTGDDVRRLTVADVTALGGDPDHAHRAFHFHRQLAAVPMVGHRPLVGVEQPTVSSLRLRDGVVDGLAHTFRVHTDGELVRDAHGMLVHTGGTGDGTVPVNSATLPGATPQAEAQQHGALGHVDEVVTFVRWVITGQPQGGQLGPGDRIGIDVPDLVQPGTAWPVVVSGVAGPHDATCEIIDAETGIPVDHPALHWRDNQWQFTTSVPQQHLYRVIVTGGGGSPLTRLVLATDPATPPATAIHTALKLI
ncbi:MAG: lipase/acyltransferase domain-containing protein, partial [Sciscionella sp.]